MSTKTDSTVIGRPTNYTEELANAICLRLANGDSLLKISEDNDMPCRSTIHEWLLDENKKYFTDKYKDAINVRTENMFDELNDIADTKTEKEDVNRSRLKIDTRKWYLSKVLPKKYGDKLDLTSKDGKLPTPLLHVLNHNIDAKDSEDEGKS